MAGVQRLQQVERFGAAHFADQDAVGRWRSVARTRSAIVTGGSGGSWPSGHLRAPRFEPQEVGLVEMDLRGLLDDDDRGRRLECARPAR